MDWLEQELKQALARQDPPADFAGRVLGGARRPARPAFWRHSRWLAAAAAIVVIAGSGAAWRYHEGLVAKDRVMQAFRIAAVQVSHIQAHIQGAEK